MIRFVIPVLIFLLTIFIGLGLRHRSPEVVIPPITHQPQPLPQPQPPSPPPQPQPEPTPEPEWTNYPALRQVSNLGVVLSDIDSHMPAGHIYRDSDKITWGHETSHGIASALRMKYSRLAGDGNENVYFGEFIDDLHGNPVFKSAARINGFYVLKDRAVIINEPNTTIQAAARLVPQSLRGGVYNLYMVQQASSWGDTPLYVMDEYVAYSNGSAVRKDLGIVSRAETVQYMFEFNVYVISLAMAIQQHDPTYNDTQFRAFVMWSIKRSMDIYDGEEGAKDYWIKVQTSQDASEWRSFASKYFGKNWCDEYLWNTK